MRKPFVPTGDYRWDTSDHIYYRLALVFRRMGWRHRSAHRRRKEGRA